MPEQDSGSARRRGPAIVAVLLVIAAVGGSLWLLVTRNGGQPRTEGGAVPSEPAPNYEFKVLAVDPPDTAEMTRTWLSTPVSASRARTPM